MPEREQDAQNVVLAPVQKITGAGSREALDSLAVEEPLEIRIGYDDEQGTRQCETVSVTMRTPGEDSELAAGFLFTEGIITESGEIEEIRSCGPQNAVLVELKSSSPVDIARLERHFVTSSSCGVCGKTSIDAVRAQNRYCELNVGGDGPIFDPRSIVGFPDALNASQSVFERTGGLHASALFDTDGRLLMCREDIGRHNALDKLIGNALLHQQVPLRDCLVLVSGRAGFELVQKIAMAGAPILAAVGAPSSIAVELARELDITLIGFLRNDRFNIYHGKRRVQEVQPTWGARRGWHSTDGARS